MGASAYATGNHVVFDRPPDLHTAAHEAAHVVQQAQGVNLYGGVGEVGDAYERHADAVADRVVAGQSAADLLGASPTQVASSGSVQMNPKDPNAPNPDDGVFYAATRHLPAPDPHAHYLKRPPITGNPYLDHQTTCDLDPEGAACFLDGVQRERIRGDVSERINEAGSDYPDRDPGRAGRQATRA
jgi:hypothetical protein